MISHLRKLEARSQVLVTFRPRAEPRNQSRSRAQLLPYLALKHLLHLRACPQKCHLGHAFDRQIACLPACLPRLQASVRLRLRLRLRLRRTQFEVSSAPVPPRRMPIQRAPPFEFSLLVAQSLETVFRSDLVSVGREISKEASLREAYG